MCGGEGVCGGVGVMAEGIDLPTSWLIAKRPFLTHDGRLKYLRRCPTALSGDERNANSLKKTLIVSSLYSDATSSTRVIPDVGRHHKEKTSDTGSRQLRNCVSTGEKSG